MLIAPFIFEVVFLMQNVVRKAVHQKICMIAIEKLLTLRETAHYIQPFGSRNVNIKYSRL